MREKVKTIFLEFILSVIVCLFIIQGKAQSSSFLADGVQDFLRREQLLGKLDLKRSLTAQTFSENYSLLDSLLPRWNNSDHLLPNSSITLQYLPISTSVQYNSHHPYGWNNESMIPAAGIQGLLSAGVNIKYGKLSLQLKPEFVYAQNPDFPGFPEEHNDIYWERYYLQLNKSDLPEKFGDKAYYKLFAGQSSIRFNTGAYSFGISTENVWWGPGRYNALILSNNAPGFLHLTFNTIKPVETSIGSFEWQMIGGKLVSSGFFPPDTNRYYNGQRLYQPKKEEDRYISGITLSWQPKWTKGLYLGFAKVSYQYLSDVSGLADIFPLEGIIKSNAEKQSKKASLGSLFARYVMPEDHVEFYFEFGRNDKSASLSNIFSESDYPSGYIAGLRKLINLKKKNEYIEIASEFIQLELPNSKLIYEGVSWYNHPYVRHGYTNQGKLLGAGIGLGSNSQSIDISWIKGFNKVGMKFERIDRNNDLYYNSFSVITHDFTRHWVDVSSSFHLDWRYKKIIFSSQMALIRSLNYEWFILPGLNYFKNTYDLLNFHASLSFAYRL